MTAEIDCEQLLNAVLPFAEDLLLKYGEYYPYGAVMLPSGDIVKVAASGDNDQPLSQNVIDVIFNGFVHEAKAGRAKATALVYDIFVILPKTGTKSDAIAVALDHRDNYAVTVILPYRIQDGGLIFDETFREEPRRSAFRQI